MVFIVKIPAKANRSPSPSGAGADANRQDQAEITDTCVAAQPTPFTAAMSSDTSQVHTERTQDVQDALDALQKLSIGAGSDMPSSETQHTDTTTHTLEPPIKAETENASPSSTASNAAPVRPPKLDVIVAPAVLAHRYVRGTDISLIVERPERVRAVLLGLSALLGRLGAEGDEATLSPERSDDVDADALVSQMAGMSVAKQEREAQRSTQSSTSLPVQVLHSVRSVPLSPPHPALAAVHSHEEELVESVLPDYEEKRRARHSKIASQEGISGGEQQSQSTSIAEQPYSDLLSQLCTYAPHSAPVVAPPPPIVTRQASTTFNTPTGRTRSTTAKDLLASASAGASPVKGFNGGQPEGAQLHNSGFAAFAHKEPVTPANEQGAFTLESDGGVGREGGDTSSSSSDDEDLHPSEVPRNMNQGDLYLRGSKKDPLSGQNDPSLYGSAEAIQHALGASIEAVDRVVRAARHTSNQQSANVTPLVFTSTQREVPAAAASPATRAFVLTRPPGHHCSGSVPSGFCWVNNAVVAAMHAYQAHGIDRIAIFDIDLHHGNGTQKIVWRINEDTRRTDIEREARLHALRSSFAVRGKGAGRGKGPRRSAESATTLEEEEKKLPPRGLQLFYGSLHDIESFPCEDGDADLVRDASTCIEGAHGQWIWNTHLDTYSSEEEFASLYDNKYSQLFNKARAFLSRTDASPDKTLILISCGFDACSYEMPGMQRHGKNVPPGFYGRFARDAVYMAEELAQGKIVSLLEGGYGDRALCSASIAHLKGLSEDVRVEPKTQPPTMNHSKPATKSAISSSCIDPYAHPWWSVESLKALEKLMARRLASNSVAQSTQSATSSPIASRRRAANTSGSTASVNEPAWLKAASQHFATFEELCEPLMRGFAPKTSAGRKR